MSRHESLRTHYGSDPIFRGTQDELGLLRAAIAHYARQASESRIRDLRIRCRAAMSNRPMKDLDQVVQYQCRNLRAEMLK